jgi:hypothetical protein
VKGRTASIFLILFTISSFIFPLSSADRGLLPVSDVDIYGPGQKAIIAWNGETERLILSTDLYASAETKVLEVLPLPSKPEVEEGSLQSFEAVQRLIIENMPRAPVSKKELEIVFHERVGAHDVTVVKASSMEELGGFIFDYADEVGVNPPSLGGDARQVLSDYLARGFNYWVFDLVDLYSTPLSVEPIACEFSSPILYYPLRISSLAEGETEIILYLLTSGEILEGLVPPKMSLARYSPTGGPVKFQLSMEELAGIDPKLARLFPGSSAAWFTAVKYKGDLSDIDFDLEIPPYGTPCRSIKVRTDKPRYRVDETVEVEVAFTHLLPGCYEAQVLHIHQIRLEIFDPTGRPVQSWSWETDADLYRKINWRASGAGNYTVKASSWWNGEKRETEDAAHIIIFPRDRPPALTGIRWLSMGAGLAAPSILIGALLTYLLLKHRGGIKR